MIRPRILIRLALAGPVLALLAGCSQTGDFGRSPRVDPTSSYAVSQPDNPNREAELDLTDDEREMNSRIYRFVSMGQSAPWLAAIRRGAGGANPSSVDQSAYYQWLHDTDFASSHGRYNKLENDIELDILSLPKTFGAICAVQQTDRRRELAASQITSIGPDAQAAVSSRLAENSARIAQFTAALGYRYDSYTYALEHLLVDSPNEQARSVDAALSRLGAASQQAYSNQFCSGGASHFATINMPSIS